MNERINDLFDKALDEVVPNTWTNLTMDQLNDIKNKFAELILQECVQACINEGKTYEVESAGEYASNLYVTAIKKHFELEEQVTESNEWHTCPYAEEIHHDYDTLCDCDEEQAYQCSRDI